MACQFDDNKIGDRLYIRATVICKCGFVSIYDKLWATYRGHHPYDGMRVAVIAYDIKQKCGGCGVDVWGGCEICDDGGIGQLFSQKVENVATNKM